VRYVELVRFAEILAGVTVREWRLAVLGNHDPMPMADALEAVGFEVLLNRSVTVGASRRAYRDYRARRRALFLYRRGARGPARRRRDVPHCARAFGRDGRLCPRRRDRVLFVWTYHGGQICLRSGRPLVTKLRRCRHGASGLWRDGAILGYTSRGLGISGRRMRFNCPGEMTLVHSAARAGVTLARACWRQTRVPITTRFAALKTTPAAKAMA